MADGTQSDAVQAEIESVLPDALVVDRTAHMSTARANNDAQMFENMTLIFPVLAYAVAALIVMTTLSRMIDNQRMQMGTLQALGFSAGKAGRFLAQSQVAKAQREQPCRCRLEGFADIAGHGPHLFRQTVRHTRHPIGKLHKSHLTSLVQRDAPQLWGTSRITQPGAAAVRADALPQELFHPLHALFILDLGEGVLHGIGGIEIGKIQLPGLIGIFVMIKNVLLLRRAMENDILFPVGQVAEGHIGAHAHLPADIHHQRPHQALPRGHGTFVDRKRIVRHKGALVHGHHHAGTAAGAAGTLTVEGKFFSGKRAHAGTALRAEQRLFCRHGKGSSQRPHCGQG